MNKYVFEDLHIGMTAEFWRIVDTQMIKLFAELSGDKNPIHTDAEYAKRFGFKDQVALGLLCSSLFSELVGVHLPGGNSLCAEISCTFLKPVFPGEVLMVSGFVDCLSPAFQSAKIEEKVITQGGEVCVKARILFLSKSKLCNCANFFVLAVEER